MSQNRPYNSFFLHFTKELEVAELMMRGGVNDPLEDLPTTQVVTVNQLQNAILHPGDSVNPLFAFCVDDTNDRRIIRRLSSGKRNEIIQFFCYLNVCGCTDRSPTRIYCECVPFENVPGTNA